MYFYNWKISAGYTYALTPVSIIVPKIEKPTSIINPGKLDFEAYSNNKTIYCNCTDFQIFNIKNQNVTSQNGSLASGVYIVQTKAGSKKVVVK